MNKFIPKMVSKTWGSETVWAHTPEYVGKLWQILSGHSTNIRYHFSKDETLHVFSGEGYVDFYTMSEDGDLEHSQHIHVTSGSSIYIPSGKIHKVYAIDDMIVLSATADGLNDIATIKNRNVTK